MLAAARRTERGHYPCWLARLFHHAINQFDSRNLSLRKTLTPGRLQSQSYLHSQDESFAPKEFDAALEAPYELTMNGMYSIPTIVATPDDIAMNFGIAAFSNSGRTA